MCYERRRAEACVDESAHHALVNAGEPREVCVVCGVCVVCVYYCNTSEVLCVNYCRDCSNSTNFLNCMYKLVCTKELASTKILKAN
jgi:hypothetical protein